MKDNPCTITIVFCFSLIVFGSETKLIAAADCEPTNSSTSIDFRVPNGNTEGIGFYCQWSSVAQDVCGQGTQKFWINRAIGNGLSSDFAETSEKAVTDSSGRLIDAASLVGNGLVSKNVKMLLSYFSGGSLTTYVEVSLNGIKIADIKLVPGKSGSSCLDVPISAMRFAHRPSAEAGRKLNRGVNNLTLKMNRPNAGEAGVNWYSETLTAYVFLTGLKFDALAPIYLVHGIHDDGGAFEGGQTQQLFVPGTLSLTRFTQPLIDVRAGFHVVRHKSGSIQSGASQIPSGISAGPSFGAEQMHLICWSKGGLWTRAAISAKSLSESRTLTTINTPHQGAYPLPAISLQLLSLTHQILIEAAARILDPQAADLKPVDVAFASRNWGKRPHRYATPTGAKAASYYSIGTIADANRDGNIQPTEADGFMGFKFSDGSNSTILPNVLYRAAGAAINLSTNIEGATLFARILGNSPVTIGIIPNDIVVNIDSAKGDAFQSVFATGPDPSFYLNHNTSVSSAVALRIFSLIRAEQPMQ